MGHLGNPTAFRLGSQKNWHFNFFIKNTYYSELFHSLINIKDYIYYYFTNSDYSNNVIFSHLYIYKILKKISIKIYLYFVDLENISYNYINKSYELYYETYNNMKMKYYKSDLKNKNVIVNNLRNIQNSDLFVFYVSYIIFYQKLYYINRFFKKHILFKKKRYKNDLNNNIFIKFNNSISSFKYRNLINNNYLTLLWHLLKKKINLNRRIIRVGANEITNLLKKKKKEKKKIRLLRLVSNAILDKYKYKGKILNYKWVLNKMAKINIKRRVIQLFIHLFNEFDANTIELLNIQRKKNKEHIDDSNIFNSIKNFNIGRLDFCSIFLYIAKRVNFKKVKHSKTLKSKWYVIFKFLKIFERIKCIDLKGSYMLHLYGFFFLMGLFIMFSKKRFKKLGSRFNLRDSIYGIIYYGIYSNYVHDYLECQTEYLKDVITVLSNYKFDRHKISIIYFFIKNASVTSQLIAYYIAIKLRKNFSIMKILNPLKYELMRVSRYSRSIYSEALLKKVTRKMIKNRNLFLQKWVQNNIILFYHYINNVFFKYYNSIVNGVLITLNFFYYLLNLKRKKKRNLSYFIDDNYTLTLIYPILLNYNHKNWKRQFKNRIINLNNIFYYALKNIYNATCYKMYKLVNTKLIYMNAFFLKNFINFKLIKDMWLNFQNFNLRNFRRRYLSNYQTNLYGFKFVIKGRFSRKQRASKVIMSVGKVPLNTAIAKIDYTFLTVPIKNSAVSVKVFLYKSNSNLMRYKQVVKF